MLNRLQIFVLAAAVLALSGCTPNRSPNVVLIVVDTLRADHLNHYGYHRSTASALDDFAATSNVFTDCTSSAPWTVPSVASIMTGLHPERHRLHRMGFALPEDLVTVAETLQTGGWYTAAISFNPAVRSDFGFGQGFERFDDHGGKFASYPDAAEMVERVDAWLAEGLPQPFFLYLQPMNVHGPYKVPEGERSALLGRPPSREFKYFGEPMRSIMREGRLDLRAEVDPAYVESLVDQYDTAVRYTTDQVAQVFALLENRGLWDNTLVILTSDHGEELFDHGGFNHGTSMYRELLHVPLYVKLPGQQGGARIKASAALLDLAPTIFDVVGLAPPQGLDGCTLRDIIDGPSSADPIRRTRVYGSRWQKHFVGGAISNGRFKLVEVESSYERGPAGSRLYDLRTDPGETTDLSQIKSDEVERLRGKLNSLISRYREHAGPKAEDRRELLETDVEKLRALGYVE